MKVLRARRPDGDVYYDAEKLKKIDQEQGRVQLNSEEAEALIALSVARQLAEDAYRVLKKHAKYSGADRRLNMAIPMLRTANTLMSDKVAGKQLLTITNNANDVDIVLSSHPQPGYVNIDKQTLAHVFNRAMDACDFYCTANREESKCCQLRIALNNIPGIKQAAKANSKDPSRCPCATLRLEEEDC